MARYIKKHRKQFAGFAIPVFFLFLLGTLSLSVFPGWLKPSWGVIGAPCVSLAACAGVPPTQCDPATASLLLACDLCAGEICSFDSASTTSLCTQGTAPLPTCPNQGDPGCFAQCFTTIFFPQATIASAGVDCGPSDQFCQDISGGNLPNECRTGACQTIATPDPLNPSGCDYQLVPETQNADCVLCSDEGTGIPPACGNGICEPDEGEDCISCSIDCLIPGFEDTCPLTTGPEIEIACTIPPPTVVFDGPPYNVSGSGECEDGDLCTDNVCMGSGPSTTCEATDKACDATDADFCCPPGCDASTDIDCYVPEECAPSPSPSPTPPVTGLCLTGSSLISGDGNPAPACDCSLNPDAPMAPGKAGAMGLMLLVVAAFLTALRKKANL